MEKKHQWKIYNANIMFKLFDLFFVFCCYIILIVSALYISFSNYSQYVKAPFYVLFILLITYVTYVTTSYWPGRKDKKDRKYLKEINEKNEVPNPSESIRIFELFQRFFIIYSEYILIIIVIFILFLIFYNIFIGVLTFTLTKSIWGTLILIILFLALIKNSFYQLSSDSDIVALIKDLRFYIPCLITDTIDFIKKDYLNTPSTTFIVFIIILIYIAIFFLIPLINLDGGKLLITGPQNLNVSTHFSMNELEFNKNTTNSYTSTALDFSYNDISFTEITLSNGYTRDKLTNNLEPFKNIEKNENIKIESFTGLVQHDTNYNFGKKIYNDNEEVIQEFNVEELYNETNMNITNQLSKIYSAYQAFMDLFKGIKSPYNYNYGLSFWIYINTFHFKKIAPNMQEIMKFGERFSLLYDTIENELVITIQEDEVYRSKGILYQRWNHIVINSNDSKLDLFINNNLVGTYPYKAASFVDLYDSLDVGSIKNNNFGSICNFRYYNNLDLNKIKSIYRKYNKKNPPL